MKVFTHGSVINFQESAREMFVPDLENLLKQKLMGSNAVLFGTIELDKEEIRLFGRVKSIVLEELNDEYEVVFITQDGQQMCVNHPLKSLLLSHDASFDVMENEERIHYQVIYNTFSLTETDEEISYFFASEHQVKNPLEYVVEFWQHVVDVGRDIDFSVAGCTAFDVRNSKK